MLGQNLFSRWFTNPPTVIFQKVEKKILKFFFVLSADSLILFVSLKKKIFFWLCLCIFESDTVKNDYPFQI